jgi:hypothetical protein
MRIGQALRWIWASPWSLFGALLGLIVLLTGGRARRVGAVLELCDGGASWLLDRLPFAAGASAVTLGHVILGRTAEILESSREHELVHVRQYERWGPLFVPVYLLCSAVLWLRGRHPYYDNPFEREAYFDP